MPSGALFQARLRIRLFCVSFVSETTLWPPHFQGQREEERTCMPNKKLIEEMDETCEIDGNKLQPFSSPFWKTNGVSVCQSPNFFNLLLRCWGAPSEREGMGFQLCSNYVVDFRYSMSDWWLDSYRPRGCQNPPMKWQMNFQTPMKCSNEFQGWKVDGKLKPHDRLGLDNNAWRPKVLNAWWHVAPHWVMTAGTLAMTWGQKFLEFKFLDIRIHVWEMYPTFTQQSTKNADGSFEMSKGWNLRGSTWSKIPLKKAMASLGGFQHGSYPGYPAG